MLGTSGTWAQGRLREKNLWHYSPVLKTSAVVFIQNRGRLLSSLTSGLCWFFLKQEEEEELPRPSEICSDWTDPLHSPKTQPEPALSPDFLGLSPSWQTASISTRSRFVTFLFSAYWLCFHSSACSEILLSQTNNYIKNDFQLYFQ